MIPFYIISVYLICLLILLLIYQIGTKIFYKKALRKKAESDYERFIAEQRLGDLNGENRD